MSDLNDKKQVLINVVKALAKELGRTPTLVEAERHPDFSRYRADRYFNNYTGLLEAADLPRHGQRRIDVKEEQKLLKQYKSLCSRKEQIQGFFRHILNLEELFERAGNPEILKLSFQPDTHAKYRDRIALAAYKLFLQWFKPHIHLIGGDFADCEGLSHWPDASLEPRRIVPEMKESRQLLEELIAVTPEASTRIFLEGNHENWIDQALGKMPELFDGLADLGLDINVKKLLSLEKYGYELFPVNHLVQIGNAHFTHGIYTGNNHAKKHLDVFKTSIYYGHLHDNQSYNQTSIHGNIEAASQGCLCRLDAKFLKGRPNNWVHGHGVFEFRRDGSYTRYFVPINSGVSSFGGILFDGNKGA